jgi:hypothetical protein
VNILLDRPFHCPICSQRVRQLYPLTHYDDKKRRWVNVNACLACCGPAGNDDQIAWPNLLRHRPIER